MNTEKNDHTICTYRNNNVYYSPILISQCVQLQKFLNNYIKKNLTSNSVQLKKDKKTTKIKKPQNN